MLQPINFILFILPLALIIGLYLLLADLNKLKQPFGYKVTTPIDSEIFLSLKKAYYKKVLYVSVPIITIIPIIAIFVKSFLIGSMLLVTSILTITIVNFIFYIDSYKKIKEIQETH